VFGEPMRHLECGKKICLNDDYMGNGASGYGGLAPLIRVILLKLYIYITVACFEWNKTKHIISGAKDRQTLLT